MARFADKSQQRGIGLLTRRAAGSSGLGGGDEPVLSCFGVRSTRSHVPFASSRRVTCASRPVASAAAVFRSVQEFAGLWHQFLRCSTALLGWRWGARHRSAPLSCHRFVQFGGWRRTGAFLCGRSINTGLGSLFAGPAPAWPRRSARLPPPPPATRHHPSSRPKACPFVAGACRESSSDTPGRLAPARACRRWSRSLKGCSQGPHLRRPFQGRINPAHHPGVALADSRDPRLRTAQPFGLDPTQQRPRHRLSALAFRRLLGLGGGRRVCGSLSGRSINTRTVSCLHVQPHRLPAKARGVGGTRPAPRSRHRRMTPK
jgi:hypothetical protein